MSLSQKCLVTLLGLIAASAATSVDVSTENLTPSENTGRGLSQPKSIEPTAKGLLALGLLGGTAGLLRQGWEFVNRPRQQGVERRDGSHAYYDYDDGDYNFYRNYASNVRAHEARTIGRFVNAFKKANRRVSNRVSARWGKMMNLARSRLRRTGRNMIHAAARAGNSIRSNARNMVVGTRSKMQQMGRNARSNMRRVGLGVRRMADRASSGGAKFRHNIVQTGRHVVSVARSGARDARNRVSKLRRNLRRVGTAISDRVSLASRRLSSGIYRRLRRRRDYNYQRLYDNLYDGVARIGSAVATGAQSSVDRIGVAARLLPDGIAYVAKEKSIQDCLLQTMCYISTPYLESNNVKRRKRSPEEEVSGNEYLHQLGVDRAFHLEGSEDESEARRAISRLMDDCEVFKCQVASLGRNAYEGWTGL